MSPAPVSVMVSCTCAGLGIHFSWTSLSSLWRWSRRQHLKYRGGEERAWSTFITPTNCRSKAVRVGLFCIVIDGWCQHFFEAFNDIHVVNKIYKDLCGSTSAVYDPSPVLIWYICTGQVSSPGLVPDMKTAGDGCNSSKWYIQFTYRALALENVAHISL